MEYTHIGEDDLVVLRHQRVRSLEQDHYTASLALEEMPDDARARLDLTELERRIHHHRGQLLSMIEPASENAPEGEGERDSSSQ